MSDPMIDLRNITFRYDDMQEKKTLDDISLTIEKGEWVTIIGSNGSGKSTLVKMINGILVPDEGEVYIDGKILSEETVWDIREQVGMVFQNPDNQFVGTTVEDDVAFGMENKGVPREEMIERVHAVLERVGMSDYLSAEPSNLSGGQKQRVAIAGILALEPDVIILDESTSMLDPMARQGIMDTIDEIKRQSQLTVIAITHDIDEATLADRIVVMDSGNIVGQGSPEIIFSYGEDLINLGLDLPFAERLKFELKNKGIAVPKEYMTEEGLLDWLWTSK